MNLLHKDGLSFVMSATRQKLAEAYLEELEVGNTVEGYEVLLQKASSWAGFTLDEARQAALKAGGPHTTEVIHAIDALAAKQGK